MPSGGAVILTDGTTVITVPPATTIDSDTGKITVTLPGGGIVALPVKLGGSGIEVHVPSGAEIDPKTGVITLPNGGRVILSGPDGMIGASGVNRLSAAANGDDLVFIVTPGTAIDPATGIMTVRNGGKITLPDGSAVTVAPGTRINPFTGEMAQPAAEAEDTGGENANNSSESGSGGGCNMGAAALLSLGIALLAKRKSR
jgi:hypothetical protein